MGAKYATPPGTTPFCVFTIGVGAAARAFPLPDRGPTSGRRTRDEFRAPRSPFPGLRERPLASASGVGPFFWTAFGGHRSLGRQRRRRRPPRSASRSPATAVFVSAQTRDAGCQRTLPFENSSAPSRYSVPLLADTSRRARRAGWLKRVQDIALQYVYDDASGRTLEPLDLHRSPAAERGLVDRVDLRAVERVRRTARCRTRSS